MQYINYVLYCNGCVMRAVHVYSKCQALCFTSFSMRFVFLVRNRLTMPKTNNAKWNYVIRQGITKPGWRKHLWFMMRQRMNISWLEIWYYILNINYPLMHAILGENQQWWTPSFHFSDKQTRLFHSESFVNKHIPIELHNWTQQICNMVRIFSESQLKRLQ